MATGSSSPELPARAAPRPGWLALLGAFDPGWSNLRNAGRAVVAVLISGLLVGGLALWLRPPPTSIVVAAMIAVMNGSIALLVIADRPVANLPLLLAGMLLTIAGVGALSMLAAQLAPLLAQALFVAIVYVGLTVRSRGLPFALWGTLAMVDGLLLLIVGATAAQIPWIAIAALLTTGVVYLVRFVIWPPEPRRLLAASLESHRTRLLLALGELAGALAHPAPRSRALLRREVDRVSVSMEILERRLAEPGAAAILPQARREQLQDVLLEANLALEALFLLAQGLLARPADLTGEHRHALTVALEALRGWVASPVGGRAGVAQALAQLRERARQLAQAEPPQLRQAVRLLQVAFDIEHFAAYIESMQQIGAELQSATGLPAGGGAASGRAAAPAPGAAGVSAPGAVGRPQPSSPLSSLGLKAALASAVALLAGPIISPAYPYWVALTAYVVVAASYGATLRNALERSLAGAIGLGAGAGVGIALASLPGALVLMGLLGAAMFVLGIFLSGFSQAAFSGCIMVIFGMAYTYFIGLRQATPVLAYRLIDTLVGALIAVAVIVLIPTPRARQSLVANVQSFLQALGATLRGSLARLTALADEAPAVDGRALDSAYQAITTSLADARYEWGLLHDAHALEENLLLLRGLNILAKQVEREARRQPALEDPQLRALVARLGQQLDASAGALGAAVARSERQIAVSAGTAQDLREQVGRMLEGQGGVEPAQRARLAFLQLLFHLLLIEQLLASLARRLQIELVPARAAAP